MVSSGGSGRVGDGPDAVFDAARKRVYHGRIDDNWEDESKVTSRELQDAVDELGAGKPLSETQRPSMGCSIKWK